MTLLMSHDKQEVESITYYGCRVSPEYNTKFIFEHEEIPGSMGYQVFYFVVEYDKDGRELRRFNYYQLTSVSWKLEDPQ